VDPQYPNCDFLRHRRSFLFVDILEGLECGEAGRSMVVFESTITDTNMRNSDSSVSLHCRFSDNLPACLVWYRRSTRSDSHDTGKQKILLWHGIDDENISAASGILELFHLFRPRYNSLGNSPIYAGTRRCILWYPVAIRLRAEI